MILPFGATLLAPAPVHWEIGNAGSAMLKRKRITFEQARAAVQVFRSIPVRWLDVDLEDTLTLAAKLDIYAHDAYVIAGGAEAEVQHPRPRWQPHPCGEGGGDTSFGGDRMKVYTY